METMCGKYTLISKGKIQHDVSALVDEVCNSGCTVILVDCGDIEYKSSRHMSNSIKTVFKKKGVKISTNTIKGNNRQILLFKP